MTHSSAEALYLDLLKKCLSRPASGDELSPLAGHGRWQRFVVPPIQAVLATQRLALVKRRRFDAGARAEGRDWPAEAETMIGMRRLDNLQHCTTDVLQRGIPGDFIETGVWRGGATIFMRGVLKAFADATRIVWVADSFQGLPKQDVERYPRDAGYDFWKFPQLAIPLEEVKRNFAKYGLLDEQVRFLPGWFRDTLPTAPIGRLSVLRLDGDLYESTIVALRALYPKLSVGGYAIIDDYGAVPACRAAVEDYRAEHGLTEPLHQIDWAGVFWQRLR